MPEPQPGRVALAEIVRERGNKGEVLARSLTDVPGRLENLKSASVTLADGGERDVAVEKAWRHHQNWVLKFSGVDSIGEAQRFRGATLWVPAEKRAPLANGEYYENDLLGLTVTNAANGEIIGKVRGFERYGGPPLMQVEMGGREVLIPFAAAICRKVDVKDGVIEVDLPEGLLGL
jgi:16S rRNA processing protein RimM